MDTKELPQAVHKGAALLDDRVLGWYNRVDLDTLDMEDATKCVLGQLGQARGYDGVVYGRVYGAYNRMAEVLGIMGAQLWKHGFDQEDTLDDDLERSSDCWETLDILWRGEIMMRRERDNARA